MPGFDDFTTSLKFRDLVNQMVRDELERTRPRYQYATVTAVDTVNRKCTVQFPGESGTVTVDLGSIVPSVVGQAVRIDGLSGDRYVDDVLGLAYSSNAELDMAITTVPATATVVGGGANNTFATSTAIGGLQIDPTYDGNTSMMIEGHFYMYLSVVGPSAAKGIISLADITAGVPSSGLAVELCQMQTPKDPTAAAFFEFTPRIPIGTPPAGTRIYAAYLWGLGNTTVVNMHGAASGSVPLYQDWLRMVPEV